MSSWKRVAGWSLAKLCAEPNKRLHLRIDGRHVTLLHHRDRLFAIDSPCYHASGPLGEGVVEDIEDIPCIRCPWHNFCVALDTGERIVQDFVQGPPAATGPPTYPLQPWPATMMGKPRRQERVQRVHRVEERDGELFIEVDTWYEDKVPSDQLAMDQHRGRICISIVEGRAMEGREAPTGLKEGPMVRKSSFRRDEAQEQLRELMTQARISREAAVAAEKELPPPRLDSTPPQRSATPPPPPPLH